MTKTSEKYWDIDVTEGDLIHVQTRRENAVLEVKGIVGNRIIYDCLISNEEYYGSRDDDSVIHKQNLRSENFVLEKQDKKR